jgi:hypothetical protein
MAVAVWSSAEYQFIDFTIVGDSRVLKGELRDIIRIEHDEQGNNWRLTYSNGSYMLIKGNPTVTFKLKLKEN